MKICTDLHSMNVKDKLWKTLSIQTSKQITCLAVSVFFKAVHTVKMTVWNVAIKITVMGKVWKTFDAELSSCYAHDEQKYAYRKKAFLFLLWYWALSYLNGGGGRMAQKYKIIIHFSPSCLLYTSPSPRD